VFLASFSRPDLTAGGRANNPPVELVFESRMDGHTSCRHFDIGYSSGALV
jgi:hypothetical protein